MDVLDNAQVAQVDVDYRFKAKVSGGLTQFTWYDVYKRGGTSPGCSGVGCGCDGYGCGTGGSIQICLYADDGTPSHLSTDASTQPLQQDVFPALACTVAGNLRQGEMIRNETFAAAPQLTAGTLYHLHWHNSDPNPATNYISVDDIAIWHPSDPRQPNISDVDSAVLTGTKVIATDAPILQLLYDSGASQGQGYISPWAQSPADISGGLEAREIFQVSGASRYATAISVRINHARGGSPLNVALMDDQGTILAQGSMPASGFPIGATLDGNSKDEAALTSWGTYVFSAPLELTSGHSYALVLTASGDTLYQTYGIQKGVGYGFSPSTFFADGYGQQSKDSGSSWTGLTQPDGTATGDTNRSNADLQFYFTTQVAAGG